MIPPQPANSFRIVLQVTIGQSRMDSTLMAALREQKENLDLKNISRTAFKKLFDEKRVMIKGQPARPSSALAAGTTYVDILGFSVTPAAE